MIKRERDKMRVKQLIQELKDLDEDLVVTMADSHKGDVTVKKVSIARTTSDPDIEYVRLS